MEKLKRCKYCRSDIPKKAKVCPVCKRPLKAHGCLVSLLLFFIIGFGAFGFTMLTNDSIQRSVSGVSDSSEYITKDEYNQIEEGMSYDEVKDIIGSEGELSSTSSVGGYSMSIYTWYGNGSAGSNASVTFTNDAVTGKAQVGLK